MGGDVRAAAAKVDRLAERTDGIRGTGGGAARGDSVLLCADLAAANRSRGAIRAGRRGADSVLLDRLLGRSGQIREGTLAASGAEERGGAQEPRRLHVRRNRTGQDRIDAQWRALAVDLYAAICGICLDWV